MQGVDVESAIRAIPAHDRGHCLQCRSQNIIRIVNRWETSGPLLYCTKCGGGWIERTGSRVYEGTKRA